MITKQEVKHIASLARLGLTDKEIEKYQKDLSSVLGYVEKLKEVDVSRIKPTSHSLLTANVMRQDLADKSAAKEKLLDLAPETKEGYLKVRSIFS